MSLITGAGRQWSRAQLKERQRMKLLNTIENDGNRWAVIDTGRGEITFTLNDDGSIYALAPDGGAMQDSEREFMTDASDAEIASLRGIQL